MSELQNFLESKSDNLEKLLRQFFNIQKKNISQKPRKVHYSNEIKKHHLFQFDKKTVIKDIEDRFTSGNDINIYLSDKQNELDHVDLTLTMMGIHHLHLGEKIQSKGKRKGLIKGTKKLLFVMVKEDDVYFLNILEHDLVEGFHNLSLLDVIYKNWQKLLEPYHLKGAIRPSMKIDSEDFSKLSMNQINTIYYAEDYKVYALPGGGITTGNTDSENERRIQVFFREIEEIEDFLSANIHKIGHYIKRFSKINYNILTFSFKIIDGRFFLKNDNSRFLFTFDGKELYHYSNTPVSS